MLILRAWSRVIDSGRTEVYVRPFPGPGERRRVSLDGGGWPLWRRDGKEIFFLAQEKLMSAPVAYTDAGLQIGNPRARFAIPLRPRTRLDAYSYAVAPDGQRFLFNTFVEAGTASGFTLVVNWPLARQQ